MPPPTSEVELEALLDRSGWVWRLARSLCADEHQADDLVQDAFVVAWRRGATGAGWLSGLVRNLARRAGRDGRRRRRRERVACQPESVPGPGDTAERVALQRRLVDAVLELEEPYRTTLVQRYLDELPPRAIARAQGVPLETVNTRLTRGRAQLRRRLDAESGDRQAWLSGLAAACGVTLKPLPVGVLVMGAKAKLAAVTALVVLGGWSAWHGIGRDRGAGGERVAAKPAPETTEPNLQAPGQPAGAGGEGRTTLPAEDGGAPAAAPSPARLAVLARSAERGTPLTDLGLLLEPDHGGALTDAFGRAEIELVPGVTYELSIRGYIAGTTRFRTTVGPFEPGQEAERVLDIPTHLRLFGRVLARGDETPVAGAGVRIDSLKTWREADGLAQGGSPQADVETRPDGTFDLWLPSDRPVVGSVHAEGYALAMFGIDGAHDTPDQPLVLRLSRAPTVEVRVSDGGLPLSGARVRLETSSHRLMDTGTYNMNWMPRPARAATTDLDGRCTLVGAPVQVPLTLRVFEGTRERRVELEPFRVEEGEQRRVEVELSGGGRIAGVLLEQDGRPVPKASIWLVPADRPGRHVFPSWASPEQRVRTDEAGRFAFEDLAHGDWWVGPGPKRGLSARGLAPVAERVTLAPGALDVELEIRAHRDLTLEGRVLGPDGQPAVAQVYASGGGLFFHARTLPDGRFALGPLVPGNYMLTGAFASGNATRTEPVFAEAGAKDLVLRFAPGGILSGRITDARTGQAVPYAIRLISHQAPTAAKSLSSLGEKRDSYRIEGIEPATYTVVAHSGGDAVAVVSGVEIRAGEETAGIDLFVEPGARLRVRVEGEYEYVTVGVYRGTSVEAYGALQPGEVWDEVVPAGAVEVRVWTRDEERQARRTVDGIAGQENEVVLTLE